MNLDEAVSNIQSIPKNWQSWDPSPTREALAKEKRLAVESNNQPLAKKIWFYEETISAHMHYIGAFQLLKAEKFYDGWCALEQAEISTDRLYQHREITPDIFSISTIDTQTRLFQKLFTYKLFASPEFLIKKRTCDICDSVISLRTRCAHRKGEIYDGEYCIYKNQISELLAVAIVENPVQKYSVLAPENHDNLLVKFVTERLRSPYNRWTFRWEKKHHPHHRFKNHGRNAPCPCESGIKYKKCCLSNRDGVLRPHCNIEFSVPPPSHLSNLEYSED